MSPIEPGASMVRKWFFFFTASAVSVGAAAAALLAFIGWAVRQVVQAVAFGVALLILAVYAWHIWPLALPALRWLGRAIGS